MSEPTQPDPEAPPAAPAQPTGPDATWAEPWKDPNAPPNAPDAVAAPAPPPPAAPAVSLPAVGSVVAYDAIDPLTGDKLTGIGVVVDAYAGGEGADAQRRVLISALPVNFNLSADNVTPVAG